MQFGTDPVHVRNVQPDEVGNTAQKQTIACHTVPRNLVEPVSCAVYRSSQKSKLMAHISILTKNTTFQLSVGM
jgi:hypothetical protein